MEIYLECLYHEDVAKDATWATKVEEWTILTPKSEDADGINEKNNSDYGNT
jgi:hypothetical protein